MDRLVNQSQVARMLGVSRAAISGKLKRQREKGQSPHPLPEPDAELNGKPLWYESKIDLYKEKLFAANRCLDCGSELEKAEYLENDIKNKFDVALICTNENCSNRNYS
ncbi:hypothetical protein ACFQZE_23820 [Paenibacillus sp. GCM10027627]|uniref:hypothetical protein n=1 Tax=unclassified Paenibacillus TaxID=185978 RepID=UPI00362502A6